MRRVLIGALLLVALAAWPAGAARSSSARSLVNKLIEAGICAGPVQAVDAQGIAAMCEAPLDVVVEVRAYKARRTMLKALDVARLAQCSDTTRVFGYQAEHAFFTVGRTWFTNDFVESIGSPLRDTLGGAVKTYRCT